MPDFLTELFFLYQRLNWMSALDIVLVTLIFFGMLLAIRDTQAVVLLRGVIVVLIVIALLTTLVKLPAFSWLVRTTLPSLLLAIPVIFAPEIRRALERVGRASSSTTLPMRATSAGSRNIEETIKAVVTAASRLSDRRHGALIVMQRSDNLQEYIRTGVRMTARVTPELLLQVFYPNTPLHDGAAIIVDSRLEAAACVMPLSASGILNRSPDRQMGLRHRASLGISEASDAITVVVSEETGSISIAHNGRMIRKLDADRLENLLLAFYRPLQLPNSPLRFVRDLIRRPKGVFRED